MSILSKFKNMVVGEYDDDQELDEGVEVDLERESGRRMREREMYEADYPNESAPSGPFGGLRKKVPLKNNGQVQVFIASPDDYNKSQEISDYLKARRPVVVNLEKVEYPVAQRIMDFLSGTIYALEGSIERVTNNIFVIAPNGVEVSGDLLKEARAGGIEMTSWDYERRPR